VKAPKEAPKEAEKKATKKSKKKKKSPKKDPPPPPVPMRELKWEAKHPGEPLPEPKPVVRGKGKAGEGVAFKFGGKAYKSLTAVATLVTGTTNWGGGRFFGCDVSKLTIGQIVEREWDGKLITVEVVAKG
jgi:hypothetical protein